MTVYFTVKDEYARQLLKNVWSIDIENYIYRLGLAHFKTSDFDDRKKHRREFIGFSDEHTAAKVMKMTSPFNPKSAFKQSPDKIIIKFQNEADLFNACEKRYHFNDFSVKGYPIGYNWPQRDQAISKLKKSQNVNIHHQTCNQSTSDVANVHNINMTRCSSDNDKMNNVANKQHKSIEYQEIICNGKYTGEILAQINLAETRKSLVTYHRALVALIAYLLESIQGGD
ncbi:hypothetical protein GLOIN_2v1476568 [Rhizophagus irregularis DAOM 181602=DAOM 197198]|uniref:Uncharacterized protein n=2 Tax=Rhizophagus irregularis TaxID=588596 RepID=U9TLV3_RHIID|nr:hypothetical protein GLOIN_2v1476568 [Rhizophagus irregularis DAOM 181602=DAOM 197198]POG73945.1 hypothetical protein GLOIN_2v1476568 [Rhizophagus irregularis DAOM 181602=DAOM 197198]GBC34116.1 hypothetical protein GLOIN_2v1476568 [Rhizophagus irregularis DAOM 181602=DAOM 197198]|eukprot:XP_025180811.1 hypothetical protein GLOIN_2v1476568 [Rhizophagus irregularis DAOM 181602=DAOM 197198]